MVQTLEAIRGGGGSVKVGSTGTISALMSREMESTKSASKVASSVSDSPATTIPRKSKSRKSIDETSGSGSGSGSGSASSKSNIGNDGCPEPVRKTKHNAGKTHQIPMLAADNMPLDGTPMRPKPVKKGLNVVEIVDIKCGNPDKTWANPITTRLKKLGFSKLSDSIG